MASNRYIGRAQAIAQVDTETIINTWAAADTITLTINQKSLVVTIGSFTRGPNLIEDRFEPKGIISLSVMLATILTVPIGSNDLRVRKKILLKFCVADRSHLIFCS